MIDAMDLLRRLAEHTDIWDREAAHLRENVGSGAQPEAEDAEMAMLASAYCNHPADAHPECTNRN